MDTASKLQALRDRMKDQGLDAFLIPKTDEFQSEVGAAYAERLQWLTGFSGSAGFCIVTLQKAAVFVDGRYTVQAAQEIDTSLFEIVYIFEKKPIEWLQETLAKGQVVGFDPQLHTVDEIKRYQDLSLKRCSNLVDQIWSEQPERPAKQIIPYPEKYAGQTSLEKRQDLLPESIDLYVFTNPESIAWLLNIRGTDLECTPVVLSYAVLGQSGQVNLFCNKAQSAEAIAYCQTQNITLHNLKDFEPFLRQQKNKQIGMDPRQTPQFVLEALEDSQVTVLKDPCLIKKACKNSVELAGMRQAYLRDGIAYTKLLYWIETHPEVTEWDVVKKFKELASQRDLYQGCSFPMIAGTGANGAIIHYRPKPENPVPLQLNSFLLVDAGNQYLDGTTDTTRTIPIGNVSQLHKKRYTQVLQGHINLASARFPKGTTGPQIDCLARLPLWAEGLDYRHGTGHGIGHFLNVHEGPQFISQFNHTAEPLKPGMVLSNEPGFYQEGEFGIRLESAITVQEDASGYLSFDTLTRVPFDLRGVEKALLTVAQKRWLLEYQQTVFQDVSPYLDDQEKEFFEAHFLKL